MKMSKALIKLTISLAIAIFIQFNFKHSFIKNLQTKFKNKNHKMCPQNLGSMATKHPLQITKLSIFFG